ncbi:MAG: DNA helicase RecQ [Chitinispirillaceae bacterium]|nr:DNA helicase RecQ [Chitinispirillaceae bacterium]
MSTTAEAVPAKEQVAAALERIFGFKNFRPGQEEVVRAIMTGQDTLAVMPTGGGKSLCYQLPACLLPGTCIVVSPLIALMKDQVDAARSNGIRASFLNSSLSAGERNSVERDLVDGKLDLLYISPERFAIDAFTENLRQCSISFAAIDEAHCICAWGHDFRPDYLLLSSLKRKLPRIPVAAFTASANRTMRQDIVRQLVLHEPFLYCGSFNRENLFYEVEPKEDAERQILSFVEKYKGEPGIVYRMTREGVENTTEFLQREGISALPYHAGLDDAARSANQEAFSRDKADVVVATIAFGMGIDKSNIRYVVHGDLPRSLENYYQETGRAGRDGDPAHCFLLFNRGDLPRLHYFIDRMENEEIARQHRIALADMAAFAAQYICRRRTLLAHFGEILPGDNCGGCDVCTGSSETVDITREAQILLSAVFRTGERFGMNHVINVVRGADTRQIRSCGHHTIKTYGAGRDLPKRRWREIFEALLAEELCTVTVDAYPVVKLTKKALTVLFGDRTVSILQRTVPVRAVTAARYGGASNQLFEQLRTLRRQLAEERGVPPYVIFSDRTLHDMTGRLPSTPGAMLEVAGVGAVKLEQYGKRFLEVVLRYIDEHPDVVAERRSAPAGAVSPAAARKKRPGNSALETGKLAAQGLSLEKIAGERGCTRGTIVTHLETLFSHGHDYPIGQFIDEKLRDIIAGHFSRLGTTALRPVVEAAQGEFGYEEARLVRAWLQRQHGEGA